MKIAGALPRAALVVSVCGGSDADTSIRQVVPDKNIREEGVECAGARPFQHIHAGAPFTIEAEDGTVVAEGELPAGRAENAEPDIDWGVERIPTYCVLELEVDLPERPRYRLKLEHKRPIEFAVREGTAELVVV